MTVGAGGGGGPRPVGGGKLAVGQTNGHCGTEQDEVNGGGGG